MINPKTGNLAVWGYGLDLEKNLKINYKDARPWPTLNA